MIYFLSDVHLGLTFKKNEPRTREKIIVDFLKEIQPQCEKLFLVGDIFDFWFEYKNVVPKGFTRLFGQLAQMSDNGVEIYFFPGNHDLWVRDYFNVEFNAKICLEPTSFDLQGKKVVVAHGDNLGKHDLLGRMLSSIFRSTSARWLFQRIIHPDTFLRFGKWWSNSNRHKRGNVSHIFKGDQESVVRWAANQIASEHAADYFVFGHLHTPVIFQLQQSKVVVLGEWIEKPTVAKMENGEITLVPLYTR